MSRRQYPLRIDHDVYQELVEMAKKKNTSVNDEINEACLHHVQRNYNEAIDKIYAPIMERFVNQRLKSFENRLASLMAKNALDSAMAMFLLIDSISRARNLDPEELYQQMRSMAVKHVQKRDELLDMIKDDIQTDKR